MLFPHQVNTPGGIAKEEGPVIAVTKTVKTSTAANHTADLPEPEDNEAPELLTNEIMVDKGNRHQGSGNTTCTPYVLIKIIRQITLGSQITTRGVSDTKLLLVVESLIL